KFARALLLRLEQPYVLNGYHRLIGESPCKLDLFVAERSHRFAQQAYAADRHPFAKEGDREHGVESADPSGLSHGVFRIDLNVMHVNRSAFRSARAQSRTHAPARSGALA